MESTDRCDSTTLHGRGTFTPTPTEPSCGIHSCALRLIGAGSRYSGHRAINTVSSFLKRKNGSGKNLDPVTEGGRGRPLMPTPRKPTAGFWITTILLLPMLYVASVGPAFGILVHNMSESRISAYNFVYRPLWTVLDVFPGWVKDGVVNYSLWFSY